MFDCLRSDNLEMPFWCLQFPPKNEQKQVNLRFHSSKIEFIRLFFGGNVYLKNSFRLFLTFTCLFTKKGNLQPLKKLKKKDICASINNN